MTQPSASRRCSRLDDYVASVERAGARGARPRRDRVAAHSHRRAARAAADGRRRHRSGALRRATATRRSTSSSRAATSSSWTWRGGRSTPTCPSSRSAAAPRSSTSRRAARWSRIRLRAAAGGRSSGPTPAMPQSSIRWTSPKDHLAHDVSVSAESRPGARARGRRGPPAPVPRQQPAPPVGRRLGRRFVVVRDLARRGDRSDRSARRAFCVGVQWHPENFWRTGEFRPLFEAFVAAARGSGLPPQGSGVAKGEPRSLKPAASRTPRATRRAACSGTGRTPERAPAGSRHPANGARREPASADRTTRRRCRGAPWRTMAAMASFEMPVRGGSTRSVGAGRCRRAARNSSTPDDRRRARLAIRARSVAGPARSRGRLRRR